MRTKVRKRARIVLKRLQKSSWGTQQFRIIDVESNVEDHIMTMSRFAKYKERINCNLLEWIVYLPLFVESAISNGDNGLFYFSNMIHFIHINDNWGIEIGKCLVIDFYSKKYCKILRHIFKSFLVEIIFFH